MEVTGAALAAMLESATVAIAASSRRVATIIIMREKGPSQKVKPVLGK